MHKRFEMCSTVLQVWQAGCWMRAPAGSGACTLLNGQYPGSAVWMQWKTSQAHNGLQAVRWFCCSSATGQCSTRGMNAQVNWGRLLPSASRGRGVLMQL